MWKVFGEEGVMVQFGTLWTARMRDLSKRRKDRDRFLALLDSAEVTHYLDIHQKMHVFKMTLPSSCTVEDVEFLKGFVQRILKSVEYPMVDLDGEEQRAALIITAEESVDEHSERMANWYKQLESMEKK
ncbi:MAG: hypothetical protein A4E29_01523 [Methanomassiliicoccales archaeon PtaB.Bin134]|jgi:hypothetical protein|nr:MAG: hypothetical protein A4E29_01523 [Methanomassiliicoccales archaeon PtaB.Bin134]